MWTWLGLYMVLMYIPKKEKNQKNSSKTIHDNIYIPDKLTPLNKKNELSIDPINANSTIFFTSISHDLFSIICPK